jgi:hypothetical protein
MGEGINIEENFLDGDMSPTPEDKAREQIDKMLAQAGWHVCDFRDANIHAASQSKLGSDLI